MADQILDLEKIESKLVQLFTDKLAGKKFCEELYTKKEYDVCTGFFSRETVPDVDFNDQIPAEIFPDNAFGGREARLQFVDFLTKFETEIKEQSISIYKKIAGAEQDSLFAVLRAQQLENDNLTREQLDLAETEQRLTELATERDHLLALNQELEAKLQKYLHPVSFGFDWQQLLRSQQPRITDSATASLTELKERLLALEAGLERATKECISFSAKADLLENDLAKEQIEHQVAQEQLAASARLYENWKSDVMKTLWRKKNCRCDWGN